MIVFLVTPEHAYTHDAVKAQARGRRIEIVHYPNAFAQESIPRGTYVFTDLDRLSAADLRTAAALYRCLRDAGCRVLNDPASVPSRFGLLRGLHERGINRFNAYRVEEAVRPERWPVFVRLEGDHHVRASPLLEDWGSVCATVEQAVADGMPIANLLIVEYAGQPVQPGVYRRLGSFHVGERHFASSCVHDDNWWVKSGKLGIATPELYEDELRIARDNPYGEALAQVFAMAAVEYGRADFGLVDGAVQVYEINTNPHMAFPAEHPSPARLETYRLVRQNYQSALALLDSPDDGPPVTLASPLFAPYRKRAQQAQLLGGLIRVS